ncbi:hypothetical protein GN244_ATG02268 [Phytophthora infestans]|uniref:Secreted RxLR effector peptide protein n=1 Tax=Phytophthora infestans TaxID=4787 RepID=A0A833T2Y8_PHYIN|nr:hypothetical protein GN244_ATG02268 [Phytophthora infestans]KAF4130955.1 hypothetical protein GN958_ATG19848 [Phytophthora infestans]
MHLNPLYFLFLFLSFAYLGDPTEAKPTGTETALKSDSIRSIFEVARFLRADKAANNAEDEDLEETNEERLSLVSLKNIFQRNPKAMTALQKNPDLVRQVERVDNNPTIQKGIQSVKANREMMQKVKSLSKDPSLVKALQKSPSVKTVGQVNTYLSRGKSESSGKSVVFILIFGFFIAMGGAIGLYYLLDKLGVGNS